MQLTVSIVSFNTKDLLRRCLRSIFRFTKGLSFEVIVVDNGSSDGSAEMVERKFPQAALIKNKKNKWYTGANNQALKMAQGKYFLILNSDTFLVNNAFKNLISYLEKNPGVGAVEPRQEEESGRVVQTSSRHNRWWLDLIELTLLHKFFKPYALERFRLAGVDRKKTYPVEVISDGAMMIRTKLFKKIGGYDTRFKLYYTENDICQRLRRQSSKAVHVGRAKIKHRISASTAKVGWKIISAIYAADARQYYAKYHSIFTAAVLFGLLKLNNFVIKNKNIWPWLSLVILATVLRFYRLPEYMTFIGDQGRDYLAARDMVTSGVWPLTGIPSSVPWLHQGVLFIWATAAMFRLGGFAPYVPAVLTAVLGVVSVYLMHRLFKNWWAAAVLALAPLSVIHARLPYHLSPIALVSSGYLWALKNNRVGWLIFFTALLLQFELSTLPLVFLILFWLRKNLIGLLKWAPVGLVPFLPKIIYDFSHGFSQTAGLAAWTGYRLIHFEQYGNASGNIWEFWTKFISPNYPLLSAAVGAGIILSLKRQPKFLLLPLLFILVGFYVHGAPSEGYFPVLFPVWALLIANAFSSPKGKIFLALLMVFNLVNLFKHNFYPYGPGLRERLELVEVLPLSFKLVDNAKNPGWQAYLDNYRYLIWWRGKNYRDEAGPVYSIYDGPEENFPQEPGTTVYHFDNSQKLIKYDY